MSEAKPYQNDTSKGLDAIERVRLALAMADAGCHWDLDPEYAEQLLLAYDALRAKTIAECQGFLKAEADLKMSSLHCSDGMSEITSAKRVSTGWTSAAKKLAELFGKVFSYPVKRVRHNVRGGTYDIVGFAKLQTAVAYGPFKDYAEFVVYRADEDGSLWVRLHTEFYDGRYDEITLLVDPTAFVEINAAFVPGDPPTTADSLLKLIDRAGFKLVRK
jgi:hypothetical protein